jgi:hypothetical protein
MPVGPLRRGLPRHDIKLCDTTCPLAPSRGAGPPLPSEASERNAHERSGPKASRCEAEPSDSPTSHREILTLHPSAGRGASRLNTAAGGGVRTASRSTGRPPPRRRPARRRRVRARRGYRADVRGRCDSMSRWRVGRRPSPVRGRFERCGPLVDQDCCCLMLNIQVIENLSTSVPASSPQICFLRGIATVPPADSFSKYSRRLASSPPR